MAEGLKVLMMGGQRVGKSSALAAVMDAFISGKAKDILTANDTSVLESGTDGRKVSISSKLADVKKMLKTSLGKTILVDSGKTNNRIDYKLELTLSGTNDAFEITFTDLNGEFFEGGNINQEEVIELVKSYDVFIVAVDTTFMMEARNDQSELVDCIINEQYNCVESIHTFLSQIDDKEGKDAKLVIFTPIKCERWAKEGKLQEVSEAVIDDYETALKHLRKYTSVQIEVLPIQTIGSIVFAEHKEAYVCNWTEKKFFFFKHDCESKCSRSEKYPHLLRLADGSEKWMDASTNLREDMDAVLIQGTDIVRPNSWFNVISSTYSPHNCEQLAYHILEFMLAKVLDAKVNQRESENVYLRGLQDAMNEMLNFGSFGLWNKLRDKFGGISLEKMQKVMRTLESKNLIRHSGEGIAILEKCNFKNQAND